MIKQVGGQEPQEVDKISLLGAEWNAWRVVCRELQALNINIDQEPPLYTALVNWGECRKEQGNHQA